MDALPPDPYAALGLAKDATAAAIKQQYRKLVLRLHPDKVQDDALKQAAADEFHKVQTAYEIVGDDDRRQRYDAQCRLVELRRDAMERGGRPRGGSDVRTAAYKMPTDAPAGGDFYARGPERSGRMSPRYEERRPNYADDYFSPRPMSRKDSDFDRSSKRAPPREDPKKSKSSTKKSKENERSSRDERARRTDQDVRKERERKFAFVSEHSPAGDSDEQERVRRQRRDDEEVRQPRPSLGDDWRKEQEATASFFGTERTQKMFEQDWSARQYMSTSGNTPLERPTSERRPSPIRKSSSREKVEYIKRTDGKPPVMIRRGSGRPETTRESRKSSSREKDIDIVEEPEEMLRRPPTLNKTQSSPVDIRPPIERVRSNTLQSDPREPPIPQVRRAETFTGGAYGEPRRKDPSKLRTEIPQSYPTPEATPEPQPRKHSYGNAYADAAPEYQAPDRYRTEFREPTSKPRYEQSPSPIREPRERQRSTPGNHSSPQPPPGPKRTISKSYSYPDPNEIVDPAGRRPSLAREASKGLFGEIGTAQPSRSTSQRKYSPPPESISYSPRPEWKDVKTATGNGNSSRRSNRHFSSRQGTPVSVR